MGVDQIFTISAKFHNTGIPGILGIPGVRAVSQFLRCFILKVENEFHGESKVKILMSFETYRWPGTSAEEPCTESAVGTAVNREELSITSAVLYGFTISNHHTLGH